MIFVTVGTQLPFDRLVTAVDRWAGERRRSDVFAQIGPTDLVPRHIEHAHHLDPATCRRRMQEATAIVSHAGMGTVLTALELGKPLLVLPRRASLGEHRNEHQLATARRLADLGRVTVSFDEEEIPSMLDRLDRAAGVNAIGPHASERLIAALGAFIGAAT